MPLVGSGVARALGQEAFEGDVPVLDVSGASMYGAAVVAVVPIVVSEKAGETAPDLENPPPPPEPLSTLNLATSNRFRCSSFSSSAERYVHGIPLGFDAPVPVP